MTVQRTMNRFDLHREYPVACLHAVGLSASVNGTRLLSLSTIADVKISNPPWVNFQSAGWVSFQSAPTVTSSYGNSIEQRDAAHRRELTLKEELEFLTARHARVLAREETLENTICVMSEQNRYHEICCSKSNWGNDK